MLAIKTFLLIFDLFIENRKLTSQKSFDLFF